MLQLSGLARSTFYYYIQHPITDKYEEEKLDIQDIFDANKGRYGYRRVLSVLKQKGYTINHKTVLKLMNKLNIKVKQRKNEKYHSYKGEVGKVADNLLKRDFRNDFPLPLILPIKLCYSLTSYFCIEIILRIQHCNLP